MQQRFSRPSNSKRAMYVSSRFSEDNPSQGNVRRFTQKELIEQIDVDLADIQKRKLDEATEERSGKNRRVDNADISNDDSRWASDDLNIQNVLEGKTIMDTSHAGGELLQILWDDNSSDRSSQYYDPRSSRNDALQIRDQAFNMQMPQMICAFMKWQRASSSKGLESFDPIKDFNGRATKSEIKVVDIFFTKFLPCNTDTSTVDASTGLCAELILQGMMPSAPIRPATVISTRTLQYFHNASLRCPHLSIESFLKGLADTHGIIYEQHLSKQFTIAYDLYIKLRGEVERKVMDALRRTTKHWRLQNNCSACTYELEEEKPMRFRILVTMDGNDSLKCVLRKNMEDGDDGNPLTSTTEIMDSRTVKGDYFLSRDNVNRWSHNNTQPGEDLRTEYHGDNSEDTPCSSRWKNMMSDKTAHMWSVFDETGIFLCLCRHGFPLVVTDMVQSGEQSKYPLAVVETLLSALGSDIGGGYDIGCRFSTTLARSSLGNQARELNYTSLVGSFHGHAHNRLCQLSHLATYVSGIGLDDLEGCERFFSKSNALAASICYASRFHRQQKINNFLEHMDSFEVSQSLSSFLVNNYKQALNIIAGEKNLQISMQANGINDPIIFTQWLDEEREYLKGLLHEPIQETLEMEYYQRLVDLEELRIQSAALGNYEEDGEGVKLLWVGTSQSQGPYKAPKGTASAVKRRHARERFDRCLGVVQELEIKLDVEERWTKESPAWQKAASMVNRRRYQRCLDELEGLVVSRIFELSKMNMSHTGYKLRQHVAKALKARSVAIKNSLERYNIATLAMSPKRPTLSWEEVVEYAFLANFDLLRESRQDIRGRPWSRPAIRTLMDQWFKVERAKEEILRLNIEIKRVVTHIQDEERYLYHKEKEIATIDPLLSHHIRSYRLQRTRYNPLHMTRFQKLASLPAFSGTLVPGTPKIKSLLVGTVIDTSLSPVSTDAGNSMTINEPMSSAGDLDINNDETQGQAIEDELRERFETVLAVAF